MKTLLVIEDNQDSRTLFCEILEDAGFSVLSVETAEDGLAQLPGKPVDLILLDLSLPGMNGLEATRQLKADPLHCAIPVLLLTAHAYAADEQAAYQAGCDGYLTKPINESLLLQTIAQLLQQPALHPERSP